jgi:hypothetical protein
MIKNELNSAAGGNGDETKNLKAPEKKPLGRLTKKGGYRRLKAGAYRKALLKAIDTADSALFRKKLDLTRMVRFNEDEGVYELRIGIGRRCVQIDTVEIPKGSVATFDNVEDLRLALVELRLRTERGDYDDALEKKRIKRQLHAGKMLRARLNVGFLDEASLAEIDEAASKDSSEKKQRNVGLTDEKREKIFDIDPNPVVPGVDIPFGDENDDALHEYEEHDDEHPFKRAA